jgi:hypothetical protein
MKAKTDVVERLHDAAMDFAAIWDCAGARRVQKPVYEGYLAAVDLS